MEDYITDNLTDLELSILSQEIFQVDMMMNLSSAKIQYVSENLYYSMKSLELRDLKGFIIIMTSSKSVNEFVLKEVVSKKYNYDSFKRKIDRSSGKILVLGKNAKNFVRKYSIDMRLKKYSFYPRLLGEEPELISFI